MTHFILHFRSKFLLTGHKNFPQILVEIKFSLYLLFLFQFLFNGCLNFARLDRQGAERRERIHFRGRYLAPEEHVAIVVNERPVAERFVQIDP